MLALAILQVVFSVVSPQDSDEVPTIPRRDAIRAAQLYMTLWLLAVAVVVVGFAAGGFAWAAGFLWRTHRWPISAAVIAAALVTGAITITFSALGLELPTGLVAGRL